MNVIDAYEMIRTTVHHHHILGCSRAELMDLAMKIGGYSEDAQIDAVRAALAAAKYRSMKLEQLERTA